MRMLSNHSSVCLHVITDYPQHLSNLSIPRVLFSRDFFEHPNNSVVCQATSYILETDNISAIYDLFQCKRGKILPVRFVPYTKIFIFYQYLFTPSMDKIHETLECFTELHAHRVDLLVIHGSESTASYVYFEGNRNYGDYSASASSYIKHNNINWRRWRPNFQHATQTFKAGFHHYEPYVSINKVNGEYEGLDMYIMKEITRGWNVEYVVYPDMAFDMTTRDVLNHKLHTALCAVWHVRVPPEVFDTSAPYAESCVTFIVPKPTRTMSLFFLIDSQHYSFWLVIILNCMITSIMLYIINLVYNHYVDIDSNRLNMGLLSAFFLTYGALWLNTLDIPPRRRAERIVYINWLIVVMVLINAYSTGISSCLTVPKYTRTINTFEDILSNGLVWEQDGSGSYSMFEHSVDPQLATIANSSVGPNSGTARNKIIYITNVLYQKYVNGYIPVDSKGRYDHQLLKECAGLFNYVYPMSKHSSFRMSFDEKIFMMVEGGLIKRWTDELYWNKKNVQGFGLGVLESNKDESGMYIEFETILGLLFIVMIAYLGCGVVFVLELLYKFTFG